MAYDFGFGRARRSKIESGSTPLGALCEKPKEVSSRRNKRLGAGPLGAGALATRKQLGSGPLALEQLSSGALALALIRGRVSLVLAAACHGRGRRGRVRQTSRVWGVNAGESARRRANIHFITFHLRDSHLVRKSHHTCWESLSSHGRSSSTQIPSPRPSLIAPSASTT